MVTKITVRGAVYYAGGGLPNRDSMSGLLITHNVLNNFMKKLILTLDKDTVMLIDTGDKDAFITPR